MPRLEPGPVRLLVLVRHDDDDHCQGHEEQLSLGWVHALPDGQPGAGEQGADQPIDVRSADYQYRQRQENQRGKEQKHVVTHEQEDKQHKVQREDLVRRHVILVDEVFVPAIFFCVAEDQSVIGDVDERNGSATRSQDQRLGPAWVVADRLVGHLREVPPEHADQEHQAAAVHEDGQTAALLFVEGVVSEGAVHLQHVAELQAGEQQDQDHLIAKAAHDLVADDALVEAREPLPLQLLGEAFPFAEDPAPRLGLLVVRLHLKQRILELACGRACQLLICIRVCQSHGCDGAPLLPCSARNAPSPGAPSRNGPLRLVRGLEGVGLDLALALHLHLSTVLDLLQQVLRQVPVGLHAKLQLARKALLHHPCSGIDGVTKESVARQLRAYDSCNNRAGMNAHLELHLIRLDLQHLAASSKEPLEEHSVARALVLLNVVGQDTDACNVLLANRLYLCDLVRGANVVEGRELVIQEPQQLAGGHPARELVKLIDEHEEDGNAIDLSRDWRARVHQHGPNDVHRHHELEDVEDFGGGGLLLQLLQEFDVPAPLQCVLLGDRNHER
mmetsp:Transcript_4720/g.12997  ORF Transcript_4720/g.12997 Transcript_4720/m.12997 type:complete len:558 (-) Transcript_4720:190-1863(-)